MTATAEEMDFLRAIQAKPDDDAIRLAFSDFLLETRPDQPIVAAFISSQCQRDSLGRRYYSVSDLGSGQKWTWEYGLLERVACTEAWWLKYGPELMRYHPIRYVTLTDKHTLDVTLPSVPSFQLFTWFAIKTYNPHHDNQHRLLPEIYSQLDNYTLPSAKSRRKSYNSEQAALDALSRACMRWALAALDDAGCAHGHVMEGDPNRTAPGRVGG